MTKAQAANIYKVTKIEVDRTANTAANARQEAIIEAHGRAFKRLLMRLVPTDQLTVVPFPTHTDLVPMVQSFGIDEERTSRVRYIGNLSFQFRRMEVRQFLRSAGITFAETKSKPVLLLPVLDSIGAKLLWDARNPWFDAWKTLPPSGGLVPLKLPVGDLIDIRDLSAEQAAMGDRSQIDTIGERYGAATVIIAEAVVETLTVSGVRNVNVTTRYFGGPWADRTEIRVFRIEDDEPDSNALSRIALEISRQIEDDWKLDNILQLDNSNHLTAQVRLNNLREWVEMRRRLGEVSLIHNIELVMISRAQATIRLKYFGNLAKLRTALAQYDLLLEGRAVNWVLQDTRNEYRSPPPLVGTGSEYPAAPSSEKTPQSDTMPESRGISR
ncbi:MAG: DUF2066 domain-containing protein [Pseudomonadota bacterium]|nr:DUF2066 domain-containing protein [Pseudomonadota bacterium]